MKLEYYILPRETIVVSQVDIVKILLKDPVRGGRTTNWAMKLCGYTLTYAPLKAMKGQVVADFLAAHPPMKLEEPAEEFEEVDVVHNRLVAL